MENSAAVGIPSRKRGEDVKIYKQSRYNGSNIATIMFGDEQYFNNVQLPLVKKRLATIRQRLGQIGVADPTNIQHNP